MNPAAKRPANGDSFIARLGNTLYKNKETRLSLNYAFWCLAWALCFMISDYSIEQNLIPEFWIWPVLLFPVALMPYVFYQYYRFYTGIDELTRKIQAEALAIGFALGLFILVVYISLENVGVQEPGSSEIFVIFTFSYVFGMLLRTLNYNR